MVVKIFRDIPDCHTLGVKIFRGVPDYHIDERREIYEAVLLKGIAFPFSRLLLTQVIVFSQKNFEKRMVVGNHYHPTKSKRRELFSFIGMVGEEEKNNPLQAALFRYRKGGDTEICESVLNLGDYVLVPPGYSHAFISLRPGVMMLGISNKSFSEKDLVVDELF